MNPRVLIMIAITGMVLWWQAGLTAQTDDGEPVIETGAADAPTVEEIPIEPIPEMETDAPAEAGSVEEVTTPSPRGEWDMPVQENPDFKIRKVYEFLNDEDENPAGDERSLAYEFEYFNHGAVTKAQRYNRKGQYYVVTWSTRGEAKDVTLRLDYRQGLTRDKVTTLEIPYEEAKGTFKGTFAITGDRYYLNGQVLSWRISLVRDGVIVAQEKSFVW